MNSVLGAEGCNFAAYIFASATVVAPMGALSVVASAVIASIFLHERLNVLGQLGAVLCLVGTTLIVLFAPQTTAVTRMIDLAYRVINPGARARHSRPRLRLGLLGCPCLCLLVCASSRG